MRPIYLTLFLLLTAGLTQAQIELQVTNGFLVQTGGTIVLNEANFINNATLNASGGTVLFMGTTADTISGTSPSTFYNLSVNKASNKLLLNQNISIDNALSLQNGLLELSAYDLTINPSASISTASSNAYVETSGTGLLIQEVSASDILFPVGNVTYTPITLNNSGTTDNYKIRTEDIVYLDGTSGLEIMERVVDVTWFVDEEVVGGSDLSMRPQWNASNELPFFDRSIALLAHYKNNDWLSNVVQAASGTDPYSILQTGITDLSPFAVVNSSSRVVPVELLSFNGEAIDQQSHLWWITSSEINNERYEIEWSTDGTIFTPIGQVKGAGNTIIEQQYEFVHPSPASGNNYYRLKQIDFDGSFTYSNIIDLYFEQEAEPLIFPNPTSQYLYIRNTPDMLYQLYDTQGQVVQTGRTTGQAIPLAHLPNGLYWLKLGQQFWKVVKQ